MTDAREHTVTLRAAAGGDDVALAAVVRLYHDRVYRFGLRVCRDGFDADDAVQHAFIQLSRRPDVVEHRGTLSWLIQVVRTQCLRLLRPLQRDRRKLGERADPDDAPSPNEGPESALQRWELVRQVHEAIARLDRPYREVLVLRDLEGLSGAETCEALALESSVMKVRLHRARQMLRKTITAGRVDH